MALTLPGHSAPAVGFEVPLEMLAACHGRVQHQCETLLRLLAHLQTHGADRPAQVAASAVMRYFDTAARHHHEDEEQDLFPALLESMAGSDAVCLRDLTALLSAEHRELERRWRTLRLRLEQVAGGHAATLPDAEVQGLIGLYERHIAREDAELLPMAQRLLSDAELDRIGLAMRARRGAFDPAAPAAARLD
ncbi:hemerythrin domain-containing protein [Methylibium sp.]|jgi:hemerythrin-like domain-containing protein|uniref:hemerythrin domain-containing protein n=1 Tax=Methylibium sp. TaxID=2067992 RepID=UPI003D1268C1